VGGASHSTKLRHYNLLYAGAARLARSLELEELLDTLEGDLHVFVAELARRRMFVKAGVVGWRGRAIVIPGRSGTGKSTLTAALVRAGATYFSDEYAVLDARGRVHPYPRHLSIRGHDERRRRCTPEELGGRAGCKPLPVGLVVVTNYRPGVQWQPRALTAGRAALALLDTAVPALRKPAEVLDTLQQVVSHAPSLKGARGEADEMVEALLKRLEG